LTNLKKHFSEHDSTPGKTRVSEADSLVELEGIELIGIK